MSISRLSLVLFCFISVSCDQSQEKIKFARYNVAGERLYAAYCANCHQNDGEGFRKLYPPINRSELFTANLDKMICMLKTGSNDSIVVNDVQYILPMPPSGLTDLEIAEIITYVGNRWGNEIGLIDVNSVSGTLRKCDSSQ